MQLKFPHQCAECHSWSALRDLSWGLNKILLQPCSTQCPPHTTQEGNVSCDSSLPPQRCFAQWLCTNHPVQQTVSEQMHLRFNPKPHRFNPALTRFDALSLCLGSPSVPALQAHQVPVSPVDWPHTRSWCPVPIREPKLSFLQWSGGATGHYSSWFSSGLSEARPSYKERE